MLLTGLNLTELYTPRRPAPYNAASHLSTFPAPAVLAANIFANLQQRTPRCLNYIQLPVPDWGQPFFHREGSQSLLFFAPTLLTKQARQLTLATPEILPREREKLQLRARYAQWVAQWLVFFVFRRKFFIIFRPISTPTTIAFQIKKLRPSWFNPDSFSQRFFNIFFHFALHLFDP